MRERKILCRRIDDNLQNLEREITQLDDRKKILDNDAKDKSDDIKDIESDLRSLAAAGGGAARAASRGSFTAAFTVIGALAQNRRISEIQSRLQTARADLARIER